MGEKRTVYQIQLKRGDEWIPSPFHETQDAYSVAALIAADDMRIYGVEWRVEPVWSEMDSDR